MEENKNINLMPEDLRQLESQIKAKQKETWQADLVHLDQDKLHKSKDISPARPKFGLWAKLSGLFRRQTKAPKGHEAKKTPMVLTAQISEPIMLVPASPSSQGGPVGQTPVPTPVPDRPIIPARPEPISAPIPAPEPVKTIPDMPIAPIMPTAMPIQPAVSATDNRKYHQPVQQGRGKFSDEEGVNLIPESLDLKTWHEIFNYLLISVILAGVIVGAVYAVLLVQEENLIKETNTAASEIGDLEKEILGFQIVNDEITLLGNQIKLINDVLHRHVYWTQFFAKLEKYTWRDVYYTGFSAGNKGAFTLDAVGPNLDAVSSQLKVLQSEEAREFVKSVSITSASQSEAGVEFSINFILNDQLFYYD